MINKIWALAGMKALAEIADIYPRMTSIHDSSLFDDSFAASMEGVDFHRGHNLLECCHHKINNKLFSFVNFSLVPKMVLFRHVTDFLLLE